MNVSNDPIQFVMTGGTIDSRYDGTVDTVVPVERSVIADYMTGVRTERPLRYEQVCMLDSRMVTDEHRRDMVEAIENTEVKKIILTHGNYTLLETARYVNSHLRDRTKVVVLIGASIPLERVTMSDGGFNIGFAFAMVDFLDPGVYVAVGARIYTPAEVISYLEEGRFMSIFSK